jgi:hypothetical protein
MTGRRRSKRSTAGSGCAWCREADRTPSRPSSLTNNGRTRLARRLSRCGCLPLHAGSVLSRLATFLETQPDLQAIVEAVSLASGTGNLDLEFLLPEPELSHPGGGRARRRPGAPF